MASLESELKAWAAGTAKGSKGGGDLNYQLSLLAKKKGYDDDYFAKLDEEKELARRAAEQQRIDANTDKRSLLAKTVSQVNPFDSGKSFKTHEASEEQRDKSGWTQGKELATTIFSGLEKTGDAVEALTGIAEQRARHWQRQLAEGKISLKEYQRLLEEQMADTAWAGTEDKGLADRLKTSAGVALEGTSEVVPFTKGAKLLDLTRRGGAALGAGVGAAHGTGSELTNQEGFNPVNVAIETGLGAVFGLAGGSLAQWNTGRRAAKLAAAETKVINETMDDAAIKAIGALDAEDAFIRSQGITDPARLLPDGSASKAARVSEIDAQLDEFRAGRAAGTRHETMLPTGEGTTPTTTTTPRMTAKGTPDMRTTAAKRQGVTTTSRQTVISSADELRALMRERTQLVKEIEAINNPQNKVAETINLVDSDMQRAVDSGNARVAKQLVGDQDYMNQQAIVADNQTRTRNTVLDEAVSGGEMVDGAKQTSKLGLRTEALSIKKDLGKLQGELPEYVTANWAGQKQVVAQHVADNFDEALQVAMGKAPPRPGAHPEAYYVELGNRLAQEGDGAALHKLVTQGDIPTSASVMGQRISTLQHLDPDNPISVARRILSERSKWGKQFSTISQEETNQITRLKNIVDAEYQKMIEAPTDVNRKAYGNAYVALRNFEAEAIANSSPKLREAVRNARFYTQAPGKVLGFTKSAVSTLDNSALGRQGWKMLWTNPKVWAKNALKSFKDIADSIGGKEVIDMTNADIISRDNSTNGLYRLAKLDVFGAKKDFMEEAFPVTFRRVRDSKTGRLAMKPFKASEAAFTSFQQRNRADAFDWFIKKAEKQGIDVSGATPESVRELRSIGKMVNSLTSRGDLGALEKGADTWNKLFFSPRLLKSHVDVLGGHILTGGGSARHLDTTGSNFVRRQAARNLLQMAVGSYASLQVLSAITGGKVESDPRSSDFGKLRIGNTRFDLTGGMGGLLTLGARLATGSSKSATTGEVKALGNEGPFSQNGWDVLMNFAENKLSPAAGAAVDILKKEDFDGNKPTAASIAKSLTVPLIIQNIGDLGKSGAANPWAAMIAEGLGISTNTFSLNSGWNRNNSKRIDGFKNTVPKSSFDKADGEFTSEFADWYNQVSGKDAYWKMPQDEREKLVNRKRDTLTDEILARYGYRYKQDTKKASTEEKYLIDELMKLR